MTKYAIIIMDGAADEPREELGGQTPLEKAHIPNCDWISKNGRLGTVQTVPAGYTPGSDVAQMSLLGYDPKVFYTGRAPLEAAARGINAKPSDWIFRCNLVTIADGIMEDYSAGHIDNVQAAELIKDINRQLGSETVQFYPGVSYRHLMIHQGGPFDVETFAPHDIMGKPAEKHLPKGKGSKELCKLISDAAEILESHEINKVRQDLGENPANSIWLWGQGHRPMLDTFQSRFGLKGAVITGVDLMRGLGKLMGMELIEVAGATGYLDTNYEGKGKAAVESLKNHDLIVVHVEAPDEAGHGALLNEKVEAIEKTDRYVVGPLLDHLRKSGQDWRIMVLPDHPTPVRVRTHTSDAVPFAQAGTGITSTNGMSYSEANGKNTGLHIDPGCELMEYFLKG